MNHRTAQTVRLFQAAILVAAGILAYLPCLHGGWIWDDAAEVTADPLLRGSGAIGRIWVHPSGADYFPLKTTVQWLEWRLWGANPFGYHCVNVGLHLLSGLLLWRLLVRLIARSRHSFSSGAIAFGAWAGAVLFVLHPLAVESVAWIAELKNALSLPPLLLAMLAWDRWERLAEDKPGGRPYWISLGWFLVALLCKTSVVMFPAVLLLHALWRRRRLGRREILATLPFFAGALALGLVTIWFQEHRAIAGADLGIAGFFTRLARARIASAFYLSKFLIPLRLAPIYPRWAVFHPEPVQFFPWAALAGLTVYLLARRDQRGALFGLGAYFAALFPVLGFIPMAYLRISWVADHFAYLSMVPLAGIFAVGASSAWERWPARRFFIGLAVAGVLALFGLGTFRQAGIYKGDETFWRYALRENPRAWLAENDLGLVLAASGRLDEAIGRYRQAIRVKPDYAEAHNNLGKALAESHLLDPAISEFREAVGLEPDYLDARTNLANALAQSGGFTEAIAQYEEVLRRRPDDPDLRAGLAHAHYELANRLGNGGQLAGARVHYEAALRLQSNYPEARANLGLALAGDHHFEEAIAQLREALREKPNSAQAHAFLGFALAGAGRYGEAVAEYEAALHCGRETSDLDYNLAVALRAAGRISEAEVEFDRAARLQAAEKEN